MATWREELAVATGAGKTVIEQTTIVSQHKHYTLTLHCIDPNHQKKTRESNAISLQRMNNIDLMAMRPMYDLAGTSAHRRFYTGESCLTLVHPSCHQLNLKPHLLF
jgi:hypothetical protein